MTACEQCVDEDAASPTKLHGIIPKRERLDVHKKEREQSLASVSSPGSRAPLVSHLAKWHAVGLAIGCASLRPHTKDAAFARCHLLG